MALNIPMPGTMIGDLMKGLDTGSNLYSRAVQPIIDREKLKQQQEEFMQDLALKKQAEARANSLLPFMIQKYKDEHQTAANEAQIKALYRGLIQDALSPGTSPNTPAPAQPLAATGAPQVSPEAPQFIGALSNAGNDAQSSPVADNAQSPIIPPEIGALIPQAANNLNGPGNLPDNSSVAAMPVTGQQTPSLDISGQGVSNQAPSIPQEYELRPGNPKLSRLDAVAGLVPGIPKPVQRIANGMIFTTYPSGRITAQQVMGETSTLHGAARDAADLEKLKNEVGEDSEVYQNAKAAYDAQLDAKKDLRDLRARTKAGLKPGEKEFFDPDSGEPLGKEVPFTEKERDSEEGNILFNELYPYVYKGAAPFSGEGSITRLKNAAANYKTDPKAKKLFDDFLLANKMLSATTVNEASTLKARGTNNTYQMLKASLDAQDIPKVVTKLISQYGIPASAQLTAAMRYQKALSDARKKAHTSVPATKKLYYDPKRQAEYEDSQDASSPKITETAGTKVINGVTYYPDGQGGWLYEPAKSN